ncbi:Angiopoietin-related protein 7 [Holothuria leucospilota]|uniref:Angiopoietin-related protein 7 n=1 Tax=Holothuria leucospilota TaxID=206669 RepID=A0A9Q1BWI8_HOLLE|nr:Angiopoietin-related protein 7 [Holothuria leucospilota]
MGSFRVIPECSLVQIFCIYIIAFAFSPSDAQQSRNGLEENNLQKSYFFYQQPEYLRDCGDVKNACSQSSNSSGVFTIKPDGYPEPFEVYCDNDFTLGGWTVIQRRADGSVGFNRDWKQFKNGFGFLSTEFWIGNEKLSYLTNQAKYELRIDIKLSNGTSLFASYSSFRISDEWSQYRVVDVGNFYGDIDITCPANMIFGNCSCQPSCDDPSGISNCYNDCNGEAEACVCSSGFLMKDGKCVLPNECGCFLAQSNSVLTTGESHVNVDCSQKCVCENGVLSCNLNYRCDSNAVCRVQDGVRGCYCHDGYEGDGETCTALHTDCYDVYRTGQRQNGVYTIMPTGWTGSPFNVYCDMTTAGGGWTLFQRRTDGVTNFYRSWTEYQHGFGSVQQGSDFWLGNEQLHYLTNQKSYKLRVDIVDSGGTPHYGEYTTFQTGDSSTKYRLRIGGHSGDTSDGMYYTNGGSFSTYDEDNDGCSYHDCAEAHRGAWWYKPYSGWCTACYYSYRYCDYFETRSSCNNLCTRSNLNGNYNGGNGQNINWYYNSYCNLNSAEMKIRPSSA